MLTLTILLYISIGLSVLFLVLPLIFQRSSRGSVRHFLGLLCVISWTAYIYMALSVSGDTTRIQPPAEDASSQENSNELPVQTADPIEEEPNQSEVESGDKMTIEQVFEELAARFLAGRFDIDQGDCKYKTVYVPLPKISRQLREKMQQAVEISGECDPEAYEDFTYLLVDAIVGKIMTRKLLVYFVTNPLRESSANVACGSYSSAFSRHIIVVSTECLQKQHFGQAIAILAHELDHMRWDEEGREFLDFGSGSKTREPHEVRAYAFDQYFYDVVLPMWYVIRFPGLLRHMINEFYMNYNYAP